MKYLLVLLVVGLGLWMLLGRHRGSLGSGTRSKKPRDVDANVIIPCNHCGVHLPLADAVEDAQGRRFCSDAHRRAAE